MQKKPLGTRRTFGRGESDPGDYPIRPRFSVKKKPRRGANAGRYRGHCRGSGREQLPAAAATTLSAVAVMTIIIIGAV